MRDVDELLRALDSPEPEGEAPAWPAPRRARWPLPALSALSALSALAAALLVWWWSSPAPTLRGLPDDAVELELRMVVERGGVAVRLPRRLPLQTGERVLFRVQADRPTQASLWVEGPSGREDIASPEVGTAPRDVGDDRGLVGYRFDGPGRYVFHLEPQDGSCAGSCPALEVEVQ
jgi:hypothetical protein